MAKNVQINPEIIQSHLGKDSSLALSDPLYDVTPFRQSLTHFLAYMPYRPINKDFKSLIEKSISYATQEMIANGATKQTIEILAIAIRNRDSKLLQENQKILGISHASLQLLEALFKEKESKAISDVLYQAYSERFLEINLMQHLKILAEHPEKSKEALTFITHCMMGTSKTALAGKLEKTCVAFSTNANVLTDSIAILYSKMGYTERAIDLLSHNYTEEYLQGDAALPRIYAMSGDLDNAAKLFEYNIQRAFLKLGNYSSSDRNAGSLVFTLMLAGRIDEAVYQINELQRTTVRHQNYKSEFDQILLTFKENFYAIPEIKGIIDEQYQDVAKLLGTVTEKTKLAQSSQSTAISAQSYESSTSSEVGESWGDDLDFDPIDNKKENEEEEKQPLHQILSFDPDDEKDIFKDLHEDTKSETKNDYTKKPIPKAIFRNIDYSVSDYRKELLKAAQDIADSFQQIVSILNHEIEQQQQAPSKNPVKENISSQNDLNDGNLTGNLLSAARNVAVALKDMLTIKRESSILPIAEQPEGALEFSKNSHRVASQQQQDIAPSPAKEDAKEEKKDSSTEHTTSAGKPSPENASERIKKSRDFWKEMVRQNPSPPKNPFDPKDKDTSRFK